MKFCFSLLLVFHLGLAFAQAQDDCVHCGQTNTEVNKKWPIEYIKVHEVNYKRNHHASFCKRPVEIIDTIVIHHSETPNTDSPERINDYHLNRGSASDPWYMIGYSYVLNTPYSGQTYPRMKMSEGRPIEIVGAHAGSNAFVPMTEEQKKVWAKKEVKCGKEGEEGVFDPTLVKNGKIKANLSTVGLVVVGNYAPFSKHNPNGYSSKNPRYPSRATLDSVARMACQLQKKYPLIKNLKWHNYYHSTTCPGNLKSYIGQIKNLARNYGCEFN